MSNKKTLGQVLRSTTYDAKFHSSALWSILKDQVHKKKNKLEDLPDKTGQIAIVTGGARGMGYHVTKALVQCGMKVVIGIRNVEAGIKLLDEFKEEKLPGSLEVLQLDISSMKSVDNFAKKVSKEYPAIDLLVNNAGAIFEHYKKTAEGFEYHMATNYFGHFLLTHILLPNLKAAGEKTEGCARVVNVSSCEHATVKIFFDDINWTKEYISTAAYAQSKLAQLMFSKYMDKMLQSRNGKVHCYAVHPGIVKTEMIEEDILKPYSRLVHRSLYKTPIEGATSIIYACLSPDIEDRGGSYISNCQIGSDSDYSRREDVQEKLFKLTCEMLEVKEFGVVDEECMEKY